MVGHELAVEQGEATDPQPRHQPCQRDLRGVGHRAEHRFAEEGTAQLHTVHPADQPPFPVAAGVPALDRVGMTGGIEAERGALDGRVDPRLVAVGAGQKHVVKGSIAGHFELPRPEPPEKRPRTMEMIQGNDRPMARLDPEDIAGIATVGHREDARGIASKQSPWVEP